MNRKGLKAPRSLLQLPSEVQAKVRTYVAQKRCSADVAQPDVKSITVPISTFPPTAMVYNITKPTVEKHSDDDSDDSKPPVDMVSAAIMAKVLEDREKERIFAKHCDTCTCHRSILVVDAETQTCSPDASSSSENQHGNHQRNVNKQTPETLNCDKGYQGTDKRQPSSATSHTIFYEINENVANAGDKIRHHVNGDCIKNAASPASYIKDKFIVRSGKNAQDCSTEENCVTKVNLNKKNSSQTLDSKRSSSFSRLNDLNRINVDKAKPFKSNNKKCDSPVEGRSTTRYWKNEKSPFDYLGTNGGSVHTENRFSDKERTHIDIINDRLWKNEWTKWKSELNAKGNKCKANCDVALDIINDRDWKNDRSSRQETTRNTAQFTLIEVKSPDNSASNHDGSQTEVATSPSFSSDSMVISSSDPSSSCSDVAQSLIGGAAVFNNIKCFGANQGRMTGPRNCLVRVTPGSKNILLDNAGHYKTVLYSGGKTNAALVHAKKTSRANSERSTSTSSEDNSPLLLQDNQLQRVAEWVQSSLCVDDSVAHDSNKMKKYDGCITSDGCSSSPMYPNCLMKYGTSTEPNGGLSCDIRDATKNSSKNVIQRNSEMNIVNGPNNISLLSELEHVEADKSEDLITFEVLDEQSSKDSNKTNLDYEVKITKEMEETYLKLAASLDPVTLSLSNTTDAELTIEKYRKDHKRLHVQRVQEKVGSKA